MDHPGIHAGLEKVQTDADMSIANISTQNEYRWRTATMTAGHCTATVKQPHNGDQTHLEQPRNWEFGRLRLGTGMEMDVLHRHCPVGQGNHPPPPGVGGRRAFGGDGRLPGIHLANGTIQKETCVPRLPRLLLCPVGCFRLPVGGQTSGKN